MAPAPFLCLIPYLMKKGLISIQENLNFYFRWMANFAFVNLLWLIFSMAGLLIGGFFPATVAMLAVVRRWILGEKVPIFQRFLSEFKSNFIKSNLYGWSLTITGIILFINYQVLISTEFNFQPWIVFCFYITLFFYVLVILNIFPVYVNFDAPWYVNIRSSLLIGVLNLHLVLGMGVLIALLIYLIFAFPVFLLFFSGSLIAYAQMWIVTHAMNKLEKRKNENILVKS
ncbi:YesL family protein [Alteribacillus sp. HJP-4]|uniref:YesL family protein n=1 Tax=Alteribacillus sp. HJP-4 TaxID=2775394 RepID=UPI0035CD24BA